MEPIVDVLTILMLALIIWQDFFSRQITVLLFPALMTLLVIDFPNGLDMQVLCWNFSVNMFFLILQLFILFYYIRFRYGKDARLFKNFFGWGDVFVLVSVCCVFSLPGFIAFIVSAGIMSMAISLFYYLFSRKQMATIPFAGVAALLFLILWSIGITDYDNLQLFASE